MYRIKPLRNRNKASSMRFSPRETVRRYSSRPKITGISMVFSMLQSMRVRVSRGRFRRRFGTRAKARARLIRTI